MVRNRALRFVSLSVPIESLSPLYTKRNLNELNNISLKKEHINVTSISIFQSVEPNFFRKVLN